MTYTHEEIEHESVCALERKLEREREKENEYERQRIEFCFLE